MPEIRFDAERRAVECEIETGPGNLDLGRIFDLMAADRAQAVACVQFLEENRPGWAVDPGADRLVVPFVEHLLENESARGLQRHQIFIDLLGPLERIAPGWRFDPRVKALMPRIVMASVVEDPFVADFWTRVLREMNPAWRDSAAARSVVPELYRRALSEETRTAGPRNVRPAELLKELSWPRYAWIKMYATTLASWPKRIASTVMALLLVLVMARVLRRRKPF